MRLPHGQRGRVFRANDLRVQKRRDRTPRHRRVQPCKRIAHGGLAKPTVADHPKTQRQKRRHSAADLRPAQRAKILHAKGKRRQNNKHKRPKRPESTRNPFRPQAQPRQAHGPDERFQRRLFGLSGHLTCLGPDISEVSASQPWWNGIAVQDFVKGRSFPDDSEVIPMNQNLGDKGPGVVFRRHDRAIGTG